MRSDFQFQLLNRVGPVDGIGRLVVIADELHERSFQGLCAGKVIGLQMFALQPTSPDFDLIKPGRVGRQPEDLEVQLPVTGLLLLMQPAFELFGGMGGSIVQNQDHRLYPSTQGFRNDLLLHKGLEIDKALALAAGSVDLAISHREPGKQMACATPMIAGFVQHWLAWACRARWLLALACLNGGFLIKSDEPGAFLQE